MAAIYLLIFLVLLIVVVCSPGDRPLNHQPKRRWNYKTERWERNPDYDR